MIIESSRFGSQEVSEEQLLTFSDGLLGFPDLKRFALLSHGHESAFHWLQSVESSAVAFVVCDPLLFVPDYQVPVREDEVSALNLAHLGDCFVLAIVNKVNDYLTANLSGPLVVGATSRLGRQMVLSDKRYSTRHRLVPSRTAMPARRVG